MPEIVAGQGAALSEDRLAEDLRQAVAALVRGRLVALPTESGYEIAASGLHANAVAQLRSIAGDAPITAVVSGMAEAKDWLPFLGSPAMRLLRKFGPGSWVLIADGGAPSGHLQHLAEPVRRSLCPARHLALRWPDHGCWSVLARALNQPVLAAEACPMVTTAELATAKWGDRVAVVVNSHECKATEPPTRLRVTGKNWTIERPGALPADAVEQLMACRVLFVCTGNTCRSPMAEALMKRLLADRLACTPEQLPARGFLVQSAGLAAMMGNEASPDAVAIVRAWGADLSSHRSRRLSFEQLMLADRVFAMTESHRWALAGLDMPEMPTPSLLSPAGDDVPDPIGAEPEVYRACAEEILSHLQQRLPEIVCA